MKSPSPVHAIYLQKRISDIEQRIAHSPALASEDAADLALEVGNELKRRISFSEIERKLIAEKHVDTDALQKGRDLLARIPRNAFGYPWLDQKQFDAAEKLEHLTALIVGLRASSQLEEIEVLLRVSLLGDSTFDSLIMALQDKPPEIDDLQSLVHSKLRLVDDADALELWSGVLRETAEGREHRIQPDPEVAGADFFSCASSEVRQRIAEYVTWVRPQLERRQASRGQTHFPVIPAGIARMLTWTGDSAGLHLAASDRILGRSVSRLAAWYRNGNDVRQLAEAFGLPVDSALLSGRLFSTVDEKRSESAKPLSALHELRQLVRVAERVTGPDSPVLRSLRTYKLGLEAVALDDLELNRDMREERLQRHLCRYLVEREILAMGTVFGRSKTDLLAEDAWGTHVVEAKRLTSPPSNTDLVKHATQLLSYLDQQPANRHGVLALYNFSGTTITAPTGFIRGRLFVLPINLCENSPSERSTSIIIEEGDGDELVRLVRLPRG